MLISNVADVGIIVGFTLTFDDPALNHNVICKVGDIVKVKLRVGSNPPSTVEFTGLITKITLPSPLEQGDNPVMVIDASQLYNSKVYTVQAYDIMDINLEDPILIP